MRLPRCRAVMKWAGGGVCVLLVALWVASRWWLISYLNPQIYVYATITPGMIMVDCAPGEPAAPVVVTSGGVEEGLHAAPYKGPPRRWFWLPRFTRSSDHQTVTVPINSLLVTAFLPTAWLFHRDRRSVRWSREGRCVGCGYDLSGVSGKCQECGKGVARL